MPDPDKITKRRIDSCRDMLVGKVPDPKSQVEQITIALIYKFMDDMDVESEEMNGERSFFAGDYARYGWANLMSPWLGGQEVLNLYAEGLAKMPKNPGIPALFRDIFKNAYLPYRDPETLRSFLKEINGFTYDHSERLGDAFEYLLSILGSQGDAGQFRTPRHIIDFIVEVVNPQIDETILDPACGTAGFLISSYKHILAAHKPPPLNAEERGHLRNILDAHTYPPLTADQRARLAKSLIGYDISPDMVRLSLVNLYLHGFRKPHIEEYDTLTSDEKWNEHADVILANPPFMSPKGGIKPHKRFSVQSNRSEVLFVDYIAEHLTPKGRAGVIVPEGIIFQSGGAYKALREMLVKNYLIAVISLPSGIFQPYTGVKTSVLVMDKRRAKDNSHIMFTEIKNVGYSLGVKRSIIDANDLPDSLSDYRAFCSGQESLSPISFTISKDKIATNSYILSAQRYRISEPRQGKVPFVALSDICTIEKGKSSSTKTLPGDYPLVLTAENMGTADHFDFEGNAVCVPLISSTGHGKASVKRLRYATGRFALANLMAAVVPTNPELLDTRFLFHVLNAAKTSLAGLMSGAANVSMKTSDLGTFQIPLPPLAVQQEIVAEIEGYQKIIDGARQVVENYKPRIEVRPEWPMVELGEVCETIMDGTHFSPQNSAEGEYRYVTAKNIKEDGLDFSSSTYITKEEHDKIYARCAVKKGDVLYIKDGATAGIATINTLEEEFSLLSSVAVLRGKKDDLDNRFICIYLNSRQGKEAMLSLVSGVAITRLTLTKIKAATIKLPDLTTQQVIATQIEEEQRLVNGNKELIRLFEDKIKATINRVWGDET